MSNEFTFAELEIRKLWLRIFLILLLFEMIDRIDAIERAWIPENAMLLGIGLGFLYKAMFYYCGYLKRGTKFLTCALLFLKRDCK